MAFLKHPEHILIMNLDSSQVYLLLGSNLGDRQKILAKAISLIGEQIGEINAVSKIYETAAWGKTDQPNFLNQAIIVATTLDPFKVLNLILGIEKELGRIRSERWGARLIDIDIIFYDHQIIDQPGTLQIPHPEMHNRKFVLEPLVSLAPDFIHPVLKQTLASILSNLNDPLSVVDINRK